eukprot:CAMPEP_0176488580 /NCGR_PEP_ID=MMETSP0200_2-20121128/6791_1 /TAXON_ID=947934 /ORGANISM="Chaetoceros sp., Strain GSL56" /LENGTH=71 /DNA_ID=CAMNT_0017885585 /DNA_START=127 /DNA_END=342 /DNA_ORIENTATION=-
MLDNITGAVGLFVGSSMILYIVTKPKRCFDNEDDSEDYDEDMKNAGAAFKGARKYSRAAMRRRSSMDEMYM